MTLDETIEKYREKGNPYGTCCEGCEKEHEQLAEWLEDYKRIKMLIPIEQSLKNEYNKAIDDFVNACEKQFTTMYGQRYVDMRDIVNMAERLKAGGNS